MTTTIPSQKRTRPQLHINLSFLHPLESTLTHRQILEIHFRLLDNDPNDSPSHTPFYQQASAPLMGDWQDDELCWDDDEIYADEFREVFVDLGQEVVGSGEDEERGEKGRERVGKKMVGGWWEMGAKKRDVVSMVMGLGVIAGVMQWSF